MRIRVLGLVTILAAGAGPVAASSAAGLATDSATDLPALEATWHACVREAYARQPRGQSRAGDERNALDECREHEDRYVAAVMASRSDRDRALPARAKALAQAWAASAAAYVWDPVTAWIGALRR